MDQNLEPRWRALWKALGAAVPPQGFYEKLITSWKEPQRHYHTLEHLRECLAQLDVVHTLADRPADIELALWFHDAVYEPGDENNELKSAYLAERAMALAGCGKDEAGTIRRMILATRHHGRPESHDESLLIDIDLSILGAPAARFDRYEDDIRAEYHSVPWPLYVTARRRVLRGFHDRPRIYNTDHFHEQLDMQARANLSRSLKRLRPWRGLGG